MIKLENFEVMGWEHVVRGMRNPMNSWEKSDSCVCYLDSDTKDDDYCMRCPLYDCDLDICTDKSSNYYIIGPNDHSLMMKLRNAGTDHRKFMRMITVYVDITAPLYWWKEFDTYKVGTVANSCSTMHKLHAYDLSLDDCSHEKLTSRSLVVLESVLSEINFWRRIYINGGRWGGVEYPARDKRAWDQMIQLLPTSYNQIRTVMFNYEVLANIYKSRKNHKLDEWHTFCDWIEGLPYSELITGPTLSDIPICNEIMNEAEKRVTNEISTVETIGTILIDASKHGEIG